jgi:predicted metal-dependent phosphoesterase TrpH
VVCDLIHHAGGLASLAHPGRTRIDSSIKTLADAGLDAIEVFHSDHDGATVQRYHALASGLGLLMTGGSDFHGDPSRGIEPGASTLPPVEWQRLNAARRRHVR